VFVRRLKARVAAKLRRLRHQVALVRPVGYTEPAAVLLAGFAGVYVLWVYFAVIMPWCSSLALISG